ncbi:hypothetical protein BC938DRAFT_481505 [Jimgerdemannia flammicorona]|uniref:Uncharacterized protein n=1 Tax=Jimgerdemannia flammicorona TaxID=994334 RepID=A0A433QG18_9FUNG|nr:hypothetical protein BC938DRAFT_481505 [Jimgerdemannia flammicorona]
MSILSWSKSLRIGPLRSALDAHCIFNFCVAPFLHCTDYFTPPYPEHGHQNSRIRNLRRCPPHQCLHGRLSGRKGHLWRR